ncbi:DUF3185 family protein [Thalassotalea ponticola]|uniref:DUF3185 family protein n=1 Tax=Thalassotalea ponticola TaxID=1523392 RepID=UPI0025B5B5F4|nr:DUF3185 family protein [Thalassotalea ponticola]MDN3651327.1 DUF3185 family protein [Thalassotalea ponticola]
MGSSKLASLILMVIGVALVVWGNQQGAGAVEQVTEAVTGQKTDEVMMFYIAGAVSFVIGLLLFFRK